MSNKLLEYSSIDNMIIETFSACTHNEMDINSAIMNITLRLSNRAADAVLPLYNLDNSVLTDIDDDLSVIMRPTAPLFASYM